MPRIAAIDFGVKRIGIAISDERKQIAFPFKVVAGGKEGVKNTVAALQPKRTELEKLVVGLPLLMSGAKGEMALAAEEFAKKLSTATGLPVELVDERLSSRHAEQSLKELSLNRKERAEQLDMSSAALLLQSYLDQLHFQFDKKNNDPQ